MTLSAYMSSTDYKYLNIWSLQLNQVGAKYADADAQAHACVVNIDARPTVIPNTWPTSYPSP
ncbi:hypothetical protein [Sinomonas sp. ASV322]|uniref:hypothetical protein n=1 Tax=Sinomonas sp. ASV322 TaxID=3041920 RepID=UPI0027DE244D|nr:hypothetical protein [Sinomonas sp. ASV322]MDQ4503234.1 hypothetical protein [Sinomonas sp. ASV322]